MDKIAQLARKHNLFIVEDAAEAHGLYIKVKKRSFSDIAAFRFLQTKI
jgi:perosamine synthetase